MSKGELTDWIDVTITSVAIAFDSYRKHKKAFTISDLNDLVMTMAVMTDELNSRKDI